MEMNLVGESVALTIAEAKFTQYIGYMPILSNPNSLQIPEQLATGDLH